MTTSLLKLAERCEGLTGPDREVDEAIHGFTGYEGYLPTPHYTASLDSAMTLVPEGWEAAIYCAPAGSDKNACVQIETEAMRQQLSFYPLESIAATPALALTAACLRARASQGGE